MKIPAVVYALIEDVPKFESLGWKPTKAFDGTNHGKYSVLMEWEGDGEPIIPNEQISLSKV